MLQRGVSTSRLAAFVTGHKETESFILMDCSPHDFDENKL